jgi:hypothetical protein
VAPRTSEPGAGTWAVAGVGRAGLGPPTASCSTCSSGWGVFRSRPPDGSTASRSWAHSRPTVTPPGSSPSRPNRGPPAAPSPSPPAPSTRPPGCGEPGTPSWPAPTRPPASSPPARDPWACPAAACGTPSGTSTLERSGGHPHSPTATSTCRRCVGGRSATRPTCRASPRPYTSTHTGWPPLTTPTRLPGSIPPGRPQAVRRDRDRLPPGPAHDMHVPSEDTCHPISQRKDTPP